MMSQLITLLMAVMLLASTAFAELTGRVVDESGSPLVGVSVITDVDGIGTLTDSNGNFLLTENKEITTLTFSSIGYKPKALRIADLSVTIVLEPTEYRLGGILVTGDRAELGISPIAFDNFSQEDIQRDYTVGEFPLLLETTPNLYSFADGGSPLGYSYTRIRGFDDKRIVTYINGVPLNDPEDHATYFVDLPDFAANVSDIQIQRGVGNSLYGDASFGGSINIVTSSFDRKKGAAITSGYGVYDGKRKSDIYKQSLEYSSGLVDGKYTFNGRFSKQKSGGYRHNSWYDGWSYYFSVGRIDPRMTTELYVYGGPMRMHLSYWGSSRDAIKLDRQANPLSYSNETDNFNQPHYHLHNVYKLNDNATLTNTLYYIRGKGYYEQFKESSSFGYYNINPASVDINPTTSLAYESGNVVRQQWVEKNQYGWNPRLDIKHNKGMHSLGGSFYYFDSDHWGQVVFAEHVNNLDPRQLYYTYYGKKNVATFFGQEYYNLNDKLSAQLTAQFRYQKYKLDQLPIGLYYGYDYNLDWFFFSPRVGLNYKVNERLSLFGNFSIASRTPSDVAIFDANDPYSVPSLDENGELTAKSERVYDFETGATFREHNYLLDLNLFYMLFNDEIVPYSGINESGIAFTTNADKSVHAGLEISAAVQTTETLKLSGNFSYNYNRIKDYIAVIDSIEIDFKDKTIPLFPDYLGNLIADYQTERFRFTYRFRLVGSQFMELYNDDDLKIEAYTVSSLSASFKLPNVFDGGSLTMLVKVDNLFNKKYEASGYGGNYAYNDGSDDIVGAWAEYYVAPERSIFGQVTLNLF